jgi:phosphatidylinositol alpha-mannosyltransferase
VEDPETLFGFPLLMRYNEPNMKIGLVCPYNVAKAGGVQELLAALQNEFLERGHDAYIITPRPQGHDAGPGERVIFVGSATDIKSPTKTTFQISGSLSESITEMLEKEQFDVLHFHEPWIPMLSAQILARSKTVNVATFHAKLPENPMSRTMAKMITPYTKPLLKYFDALTAVSDAAADYVCSLTDAPIAIIPNAIDLRTFRPPAKFDDGHEPKTILFVGRLEGRKGVRYLLHAFKLLQERRPDVSLLLAGDGVDRLKLEALVDDLELRNVAFLGYVSMADKVKYLQTSDLFCSPAIYGESFGIVLIEAMAAGLVTVAGDNPGYTGVMNGFGALSLVDPRHSVDFARRLELLLYQPELRKLWRNWAKGEIHQYTYEVIGSQYLEVYEQAIAQKKKR